ncbi:DEAD/DEAH box helicase [Falsigemmobacter faecalis]|uniref:DEAD/DEAH box helicase n=1 Tax=Falsigemmobacter faecalis TaxID=2488730 RepID=A0A3P3DHW6_9RHOB|nr:DEAD/DEAH box helicase [Falsigemmobacter faecalis]RRH73424.1 DEAD/DEAH box helicase [Falsigemmobacter faecalis]
MTLPDLAAPLAAALASKGYETLTPVQNAVLGDDYAGRDLLVSAQTGSGKTVAFGLAISPELLTGDLAIAGAPRALIIAPTRELALQVSRELEWLYAEAGAVIATCVGGMDPRNERRVLERGATIVVGTPGRLRDHIERRSLDLSELRAAVLDEADEMLDLGFQEDLEFILSAAPEDRRTLMFSATVSREIENLAKNYQNDSMRVQVKSDTKQHVDITYQAMSVRPRDKENAIINLLLIQQARVSIVFAKTRAAVTHLHARLANRGFKVVALSGELSQAERTHALQALRDGRAQVCIATDVAARGIDLPGLDLVVHFDLPSNPETLLHRSGRTGRAGSKGTAVLVVPPADFRKATRILQGAKVDAEWTSPPTAEEVQAADDARMVGSDILLAPVTEEEAPLVEAILGVSSPEAAAAAFLRMWRAGRSAPEIVGDIAPPAANSEARAPRERQEFGPSVWFSLSVGHEGRAEARWLLPKICDHGGITRNDIGAIRVQQRETYVQIADNVASKFGATAEIDDGLLLTRLDEAPNLERAPRPAFKSSDRPQGLNRKPFDRGDREDRGERRERAPRRDDEGGERRSFKPRAMETGDAGYRARPAREDGDRKPYGERKSFGDRPEGDRKPYGERKPFGERKSFGDRPDGDRKPFGERKSFGDRPDGDRKPWGKREDGDRKPFGKREDGDRKPFVKREDGDRKPRSAKPAFGADSRPARAPAPRPNFSDPSQSLRKPRSPKGPKR